MKIQSRLCALAALALAACAPTPPAPPPKPPAPPVAAAPAPAPAPPVASAPTPSPAPAQKPSTPLQPAPAAVFQPAAWSDLPGWRQDAVGEAWSAFIASCRPLAQREAWKAVCAAAPKTSPGHDAARTFFEQNFKPWQVVSAEGTDEGLITGYYEPLLRGSRTPGARYRYPLYGTPDDLLVIDLAEVYPELKGMRLRGRLDGRRVVPYYDRAQIDNGTPALRGKELVWVDDAIDLFFLQIQGSGRIVLESGETIRVGYAEQNGYPYRSIGRLLVERGELTVEQASMQGIKGWARQYPDRVAELLNSNASYVFFRELPASAGGPPGSLGVALTPQRSIAVDTRVVPLGAPVFVATTWPNSTRPLNRLTLAQDTGGAIRGAIRADFFWGYGEAAAREAGRMRQKLRMWVLLPNGHPPPAAAPQP